jgi:hypothetical protein
MSFVDIDVDVNATSVLAMLERVDDSVSMAHIVRAFTPDGPVVEALQRDVVDRFREEGDEASGAWEPLAPATEDRRFRMGYGEGPINRRTGKMYRWLTTDAGDVDVAGDGLFFTWPDVPGDMAKRFETAQFGSSETGAPARPVVAADTESLLVIMASVADWIYDTAGLDVTGGAV